MNRWAFLGLLAAVAVALFLRGGDLAFRPLHSDEAINAFKLQKLWSAGDYAYDPHEYHGPTLYYLSVPVVAAASLFRADQPDEIAMRCVPLVFGIGLILLLAMVADAFSPGELLCAGLATAVSPAMVYYSRYYIHEILLVFFTAFVLAALWRYSRKPSRAWAAVLGAGVAMMYATKETFVLAIAAMAGSLVLTLITGHSEIPAAEKTEGRLRTAFRSIPLNHAAWAIGAGVLDFVVFFTSFLSHPRGVVDAIRTYLPWAGRAGGASPHIHSWSFYFERLGWIPGTEHWRWAEAAVLLLACFGFRAGFTRRDQPGSGTVVRFLGFYSLLLAGIYCVIPYKTPWCLLGFLHGVLVLAGVGAMRLLSAAPRWPMQLPVAVGVFAVFASLGSIAWRYSRELAADFRNPFVYGHTSADIFNLLDQVRAVTTGPGSAGNVPIAVVAPESNYWPLPWYLRHSTVGWWDHLPEAPFAPVVVTAARLNAGLEEKTNRAWIQAGMFELRPRYFVELYVEAGLWKRFLAARAVDGVPKI